MKGRSFVIVPLAALIGSLAFADVTDDAMHDLEEYMLCGVDYVGAVPNATVTSAEAACVAKLDSYVSAMHTAGIRAALTNGKSPDEARVYAAKLERKSRADAQVAFAKRVQQLLAQGKR